MTIIGMVGAAAVLAIPVLLCRHERYTRIATAWSVGGLIGAYLFGVFVLLAAVWQ